MYLWTNHIHITCIFIIYLFHIFIVHPLRKCICRVCTCLLLNKKCYYIRILPPLTFTCSKHCKNGWFRRRKPVHFQYTISCINTNVAVIGITHWIIIYMWLLIKSIHIVMSDGKCYTKNKFELDRPDHDSHANRAERYLVYWLISIGLS